jgi:dipeptidyl aminopeptidase/acylaminoacyl peptidase
MGHGRTERSEGYAPPIACAGTPRAAMRPTWRTTGQRGLTLGVGIALCGFGLLAAPGQGAASTPDSGPCVKPGAAAQARHPLGMTPADILSIRDIAAQGIAPDGRAVAFVVREARLEANVYRSILYLVDASPGSCPRRLTDEAEIVNLRWVPGGNALSYLAPRAGGLRIIVRPLGRGGHLHLPRTLPTATAFEWSRDGSQIALLGMHRPDSSRIREVQNDGMIYSPQNSANDLLSGNWLPARAQLLRYSTPDSHLDTLWTAPTNHMSLAPGAWSPDSKYLAVSYMASDSAEDANNYDVGIIDIDARRLEPVTRWSGIEDSPTWSVRGHALAFRSEGNVNTLGSWIHVNTLFRHDRGAVTPLALGAAASLNDAHIVGWSADDSWLVYDRAARGAGILGLISGDGRTTRSLTQGTEHLSDCTLAPDAWRVSCIRQDLDAPPEIAIVDLRDGAIAVLTDLNPEISRIPRGSPSELQWSNKYGQVTNGFLIKPLGYEQGRRYPFLVILYNFERKFSAQAQWIPNYPVQSFASAGFVVLLMNYPAYLPFRWGRDHELARFNDRDNPLASIEAAVDTLVRMGLADPDKGGILGWSMGAYWTDLAVARTRLFRAASGGETGWRFPSTYWIGNAQWRHVQSSLMGGAPLGNSLSNYVQSAPSLLPPPTDIPTMHEFAAASLHGLEYVLWWEQEAPMELVFYPDEEHVFAKPSHRLSSMHRNLDWFNFWLLGVDDPDPSKRAQFERWRDMRNHLRRVQALASPDPP